MLHVPAKNDLRGCLAVLGGDVDDGRMLERILDGARVGRPVDVDTAERRPGLGGNSVHAMEIAQWFAGNEIVG